MGKADRQKRRAKKLARQKKKRARASRPGGDVGPVLQRTDGSEGRTWSVGECFVSEDWHEQGARVHAVVSREKGGRAVAAFFEIDLAERGVIDVRTLGGLTPDHVRGECGRISEETGDALVTCAPALVAHIVHAARAFGAERGHAQPSGLPGALALLGGIDPEDTPFEVELGRPDSDDDDAGDGWFSSLKKRWLG